VFTNVKTKGSSETRDYVINEFTVEDKQVDKLSEYMEKFDNKFNFDKIARLPKEKIKIGSITVTLQDEDLGYP
jgi:hypothetical protein